jgi:hypothetical protein
MDQDLQNLECWNTGMLEAWNAGIPPRIPHFHLRRLRLLRLLRYMAVRFGAVSGVLDAFALSGKLNCIEIPPPPRLSFSPHRTGGEMADAPDLGSGGEIHRGSSPLPSTPAAKPLQIKGETHILPFRNRLPATDHCYYIPAVAHRLGCFGLYSRAAISEGITPHVAAWPLRLTSLTIIPDQESTCQNAPSNRRGRSFR